MKSGKFKTPVTFAGISIFVSSGILGGYLIDNRPLSKNFEQGYVYEFVAHGPPVYVSNTDLMLYYGIIFFGLAVTFFGIKMKGGDK